jgi:hypothetical protein
MEDITAPKPINLPIPSVLNKFVMNPTFAAVVAVFTIGAPTAAICGAMPAASGIVEAMA